MRINCQGEASVWLQQRGAAKSRRRLEIKINNSHKLQTIVSPLKSLCSRTVSTVVSGQTSYDWGHKKNCRLYLEKKSCYKFRCDCLHLIVSRIKCDLSESRHIWQFFSSGSQPNYCPHLYHPCFVLCGVEYKTPPDILLDVKISRLRTC